MLLTNTILAGRSHVFDVVGLDVGGVCARLESLGVDVHEEVPRDVHQVEVVGVLHPRRVVAAQRELHVEPDLAGVLHLVGVEEDLGREKVNMNINSGTLSCWKRARVLEGGSNGLEFNPSVRNTCTANRREGLLVQHDA